MSNIDQQLKQKVELVQSTRCNALIESRLVLEREREMNRKNNKETSKLIKRTMDTLCRQFTG